MDNFLSVTLWKVITSQPACKWCYNHRSLCCNNCGYASKKLCRSVSFMLCFRCWRLNLGNFYLVWKNSCALILISMKFVAKGPNDDDSTSVLKLMLNYLGTITWWRHKWKHFPCNWPFVWGIQRSLGNSLHKGQWCGALMFSLIFAWINSWVNNHEAGDLRCHRTHYDVNVMPTVQNMSHGSLMIMTRRYWMSFQKTFNISVITSE